MAEEKLVLELAINASQAAKTTQDLIDANKELAKVIRNAPREGEEGFEALQQTIEDAKKEYAANRQEIIKFNASLRETEEASGSMKQLSQLLKQLEGEYKSLSKADRDAFGEDLKNRINSTRQELKDLEADLGDYRRNVGNYPENTKQNFFGLGDVIKDLGVAAAAALTFDLAKDAVANIQEITKEFTQLRGTIQTLTGETGGNLDNFTSQIAAISKTFGEDTDQILLAANSLTQNLTGDFNESLRLIEEGFLSGANANGEFLGSLEEFPALIAETGASADEFIAIISQSAQEGIFSNKGVDAIAEAGLKLREQTTATQDAIVGLFGETEGRNLLGDIETGEVQIIDAIQQISGKLGELPPQSKEVGTAIADIFGGAGEAAGLEFLKTLSDIDEGTAALIDTNNDLVRSQIAQLAAEKQLAIAQNETSKRFQSLVDGATNFGITIQTFLFTVLNGLFDAFQPIGAALGELFGKFRDLGTRIGLVSEEGGFLTLVVDAITGAFKALGFVVSQFINFLGLIVDGLGFVYDNFLLVRVAVDSVVSVFNTFRTVLSNLPATFNGIIAGVRQLASNLSDFFSTILINAQLFAKQIEGVFTVRESAQQRLNEEIAALRGRRQEIADAGQTVGEAFREAFDRTVAETQAANIIADTEQIEAEASNAGVSAGTQFKQSFNRQLDGADGAIKLADSVTEALEKSISEFSTEALRDKVNELNSLLDTLDPKSKTYADTVDRIKEATQKLNEAEEVRRQALATDDELLQQKEEQAAALEAELERIAEEQLQGRRNLIDRELAEEKIAAQKIRDLKLQEENLTGEQREAVLEEYNKAITDNELQAQRQRLALLQEGSVERLNLEADIADKELALRKQVYEQDVQNSLEAEQRKQEDRQRFGEIALEVAQTISDTAFTIYKQNLDKETNAQLAKLDAETEAKLASASYSEEEQIKIKEAAEQEKQRIEKEAAKKRKAAAIIQAIINGALAAISTLANTTIPYPAAFALLIPTAAAVAAQIAVIANQEFKKGKAPKTRKASRGLMARGRLHSQGGIPATIDGIEPVEIESEEAIVNRVSSMRHTQMLSYYNQDGGGIRFPGTKRLTAEKRTKLSLFSTLMEGDPVLAKRGLAPRMTNLREYKRKFQDGDIAATVEGVSVPVSGLSKQDAEIIAKATAEGARRGIEAANLFLQFKRQAEREQETQDKANV